MSGPGRWLARIAGPAAALAVYLLLPDGYVTPDGGWRALAEPARLTAAMVAWMGIWWISEAIPVYATAMLPLALFPVLGIASMPVTARAYGDPMLFLFLGGFLLALAVEQCGLHRRIALAALRLVGSRPATIVGAFMAITAFMSLWVTNTATTLMVLPVALSVLGAVSSEHAADGLEWSFGPALILGVAYAASIGGLGTIIGTAPNVFVASFIRNDLHREISFAGWMAFGMPVVITMLGAAWWLLTRAVYRLGREPLPGVQATLDRLTAELGPVSIAERLTGAVFLLTAAAWIGRDALTRLELAGSRPLAGLTDAGIAMVAALILFLLPGGRGSSGPLLDWQATGRVPWGLLILFGGGLSLADAIGQSGLADYLAARGQVLAVLPYWLLIMIVVTLVVFLSELASNAATAATVTPMLAAVALGSGLDPLPLVLAACFAASCGFMLPVATPPNAIAYGTGLVPAGQMARVGLLLNLLGILLITLVACLIIEPQAGAML